MKVMVDPFFGASLQNDAVEYQAIDQIFWENEKDINDQKKCVMMESVWHLKGCQYPILLARVLAIDLCENPNYIYLCTK